MAKKSEFVYAEKNGNARMFSRMAWDNHPPDHSGWKEITKQSYDRLYEKNVEASKLGNPQPAPAAPDTPPEVSEAAQQAEKEKEEAKQKAAEEKAASDARIKEDRKSVV